MFRQQFTVKRSQSRKERGMSMVSVIVTGVVLTTFVLGMLQAIMPQLKSASSLKYGNTARAYAELGMDYAIKQLNSNTPGTGSDCASSAGASTTITVPQSVLNDTNASVSVLVQTLAASATNSTGNPPSGTILYDALINNNGYTYAYRMVTVTCAYGGTTKQIRSLLSPIMSSSSTSTSTSTPSPYLFPYGVFGLSSVVYAGQAGINSYNNQFGAGNTNDSRIGADGGTLGKVSQVWSSNGGLARSIVEAGNHYEYPDPQSTYTNQFNIVGVNYNATPAGSAPWMTMTGNVYSNGVNTAYYPVTGTTDQQTSNNNNGSTDTPADNVYGLANGIDPYVPSGDAIASTATGQGTGYIPDTNSTWTSGLTDWNHTLDYPGGSLSAAPALNSDGVEFSPPSLPATPSAPSGTYNLGSVNLTGATITFNSALTAGTYVNTSGATVALATIGSLTSGKSIQLPPGNYIVNSLSLASSGNTGSTITMTSGTQTAIQAGTAAPINIYVQGTNNGSTVLSVDNNSNINMSGITGTGFNTSGNMGVNITTTTTTTSGYGSHQTTTTATSTASALDPSQLAPSPPTASGQISETAGSSGQVNFFYGGSSYNSSTSTFNSQILLGGNERMTIYAPNAGILVGSSSVDPNNGPSSITNNANFYGAMVGGSVGINSAYTSGGGTFLHYDFNLRPSGMSFINPFGGVSALQSPTSSTSVTAPTGYRAVTWQEAITPNASTPANATWAFQY